MSAKKVIIIDDHQLFRDSTKQIFDRLAGFEVVATASDAQEGEKIAIAHKPNVAIVDLSLPDKSGIQLTSVLLTLVPEIKITIVSMHTKIDYILSALRAGALGYVVKESVSTSLQPCLDAIINGEHYLDATLSDEIAAKLLEIPNENTNSTYGGLSPREQEVLRLLAQGVSTNDIANQLFISAKTVANHRSNIMAKLELHSIAELVRYAAQLGLIRDVI